MAPEDYAEGAPVPRIVRMARKSLPALFVPKRGDSPSALYPDDGITHLPFLSLGVLAKVKEASTRGLSLGQKTLFWLYKLSQKWFTHVFLMLLLISYSAVGAVMFRYLESSKENELRQELDLYEAKTLQGLWELKNSPGIPELVWKTKAKEYLIVYGSHMHRALEEGATLSEYNKWDFWSAMFFCGTVITTIGYGNNAPETGGGRVMCVVYALLGIPLLMLCLVDFGKLFTRVIKSLWLLLLRCYHAEGVKDLRRSRGGQVVTLGARALWEVAMLRDPRGVAASVPRGRKEEEAESPAPEFVVDDQFDLPASVALLLLFGYMVIGAVVFPLWEEWTFLEAFYFIFVSMSTIGFGDVLPRHPKFMMATFVYLLFGLSLMSMCVNVVTEKFSSTMAEASGKIKETLEGMTFNPDGNLWSGKVQMDEVKVEGATNGAARSPQL